MKKQYFNPQELGPAPRFYTHSVRVDGPERLVYVSGQIAFDAEGRVLGKGDMRAQAECVFENVTRCLRAAGAGWSDVIKMNGYMVNMNTENVGAYREVRQRYLKEGQLPASTLVGVTRLVHEDLLLEVEVIAALGAPAAKAKAKPAAKKAKKKRR